MIESVIKYVVNGKEFKNQEDAERYDKKLNELEKVERLEVDIEIPSMLRDKFLDYKIYMYAPSFKVYKANNEDDLKMIEDHVHILNKRLIITDRKQFPKIFVVEYNHLKNVLCIDKYLKEGEHLEKRCEDYLVEFKKFRDKINTLKGD